MALSLELSTNIPNYSQRPLGATATTKMTTLHFIDNHDDCIVCQTAGEDVYNLLEYKGKKRQSILLTDFFL